MTFCKKLWFLGYFFWGHSGVICHDIWHMTSWNTWHHTLWCHDIYEIIYHHVICQAFIVHSLIFNVVIQGVPQYCIHFCFLNFSTFYKRRNSILDIFQQPIFCRFWKYPIFYYSVKFGPRYWQNTAGRSFQKLTFFVYYSMKQFSIH